MLTYLNHYLAGRHVLHSHLAFHFDPVGRPHNFFRNRAPTFVNSALIVYRQSLRRLLTKTELLRTAYLVPWWVFWNKRICN